MGTIGEGGGGGVWTFLGHPLKNFSVALPPNLNVYSEYSAQELSIGTLFEEIG